MTIDTWLQNAVADAERRGLSDLKPILEALAKAVTVVRAADYNHNARSEPATTTEPRRPSTEP